MKSTLFISSCTTINNYKSHSTSKNYKIYDTRSKKIRSLDDMIRTISKNDMIFFGELHNDPTGHQPENEIFRMLHLKNGKDQAFSIDTASITTNLLKPWAAIVLGMKDCRTYGMRAWLIPYQSTRRKINEKIYPNHQR